MRNSYFSFKQFKIEQGRSAMKVSTDACFFGAIVANNYNSLVLNGFNVLDIGAGTGLLSMMLQQAIPLAEIEAVEIEEGAFLDLKLNCEHTSWQRVPEPFHKAIQQFKRDIRYDIILCNPPFFNNQLKSDDHQRNIARHTDDLSWEDLIEAVQQNIKKNGTWWLLLLLREWNLFVELIREEWCVEKCYYIQSYPCSKAHRVVVALSLKENAPPLFTKVEVLSIYKEKGQYSEVFKELLTDYYLYL